MKPTYILDECISCTFDRCVGHRDSRFVCSVSILGGGATDLEIYEYAKANNLIIITADMRFGYLLMKRKHPVIFRRFNKDVVMIPIKILDTMTAYLRENDKIVIP